jgi:hypothetical protein
MVSKRTVGSRAQLLDLFDPSFTVVLFSKHDLRLTVEGQGVLLAVNATLISQRDFGKPFAAMPVDQLSIALHPPICWR